jgi:hypothetical protein
MMFFGKQTKNRRMKRDSVLEVKLRSEQVRQVVHEPPGV